MKILFFIAVAFCMFSALSARSAGQYDEAAYFIGFACLNAIFLVSYDG